MFGIYGLIMMFIILSMWNYFYILQNPDTGSAKAFLSVFGHKIGYQELYEILIPTLVIWYIYIVYSVHKKCSNIRELLKSGIQTTGKIIINRDSYPCSSNKLTIFSDIKEEITTLLTTIKLVANFSILSPSNYQL